MIDVQTVIDRITSLARKRGVSINQVLRESHLNKSVLDNMKRGSMPSADKLAALADYFGCSVDYLLGRIDTPSLFPDKPAGKKAADAVPALTADEIARLRQLLGG
ncbi:MAG TPA: helix-turn-helix domain-containing protein [Firmicutes bacterium]|nr:helix-turn-helix domain-containing protein [Bacillota bacterium]